MNLYSFPVVVIIGNQEDSDMLEMTLGMLRCSVCKDRFKSVAITRCFHLFCMLIVIVVNVCLFCTIMLIVIVVNVCLFWGKFDYCYCNYRFMCSYSYSFRYYIIYNSSI